MNEALKKAQEKRREMRESGEAIQTLNHWQKWAKADTRRTAINAFCWHCMGGSENENEGIRGLIRDCTAGPESSQVCPLFNWRPYK